MIGFYDSWNQYLEMIPPERKDVYFREEYVRLYANERERACSFVYQDAGRVFVFPFLRREFVHAGRRVFDFETAYGYGGPVTNDDSDEFLARAYSSLRQSAEESGCVCGFVRFHPLLKNWRGFEAIGNVIPDRETVAIDLSKGLEAAWKNEIHSKNRNMIKKGEKNGLVFVVDENYVHLDDFVRLYNETMDKLVADSFYYFPNDYYFKLMESLKDSFLGIVKHDDQVIAAAIFFYQPPYGHYHLAGSDRESLTLSPNNFLLWGAAQEMCRRGVKSFHLGGGTDGDARNSLFLYKRRFSKSTHPFALGKVVFDQRLYDEICFEWAAANPEKVEKKKHILLKYKY